MHMYRSGGGAFALVAMAAVVIVTSAQGQDCSWTVSALLHEPYVMLNETANTTEYTGYLIDILDKAASSSGCSYTIELRNDTIYGQQTDDGEWEGVIGDVVNQVADIGAAPLIVTSAREEVVDFTYAFVTSSMYILLRRRHPQQEPEIYTYQQFLDQDEIKAGVLRDGSLHRYLLAVNSTEHQKITETLQNDGALLADSNQRGIERALAFEDYAFLTDKPTADWVVRHNCELMAIPTGVYSRMLSFAVPDQSELRDTLNTAIVDLQHTGDLAQLYAKYWGDDPCDVSAATKVMPRGHAWLYAACVVMCTLVSMRL